MRNLEKIYHYILLLFCFILPASNLAKAVPNITLIALLVLIPFHKNAKQILGFKKELLASFLFILIILFNTFVFQRTEDLSQVSRLFYIPAMFIILGPTTRFQDCMKAFVWGALSLLVASVINMSWKGDFTITNGDHVGQLLLGGRPYLGFCYLVAALLSFYLSRKSTANYLRYFYRFLPLIFIVFIFFIAARLSSLSIILALVLGILFLIKNKTIKWATMIAIPVLGMLVIGLSDNLKERLYIQDAKNNILTSEPRYYIWDCALRIMPDSATQYIFGSGYKNTIQKLTQCYTSKNNFIDAEHQKWFIQVQFETHNQFLDLLLCQGLIVLLLFVLYLGYYFYKSYTNFYAFTLILFLSLFFVLENVLTLQLGCMLVGLLLCFTTLILNRNGATNLHSTT